MINMYIKFFKNILILLECKNIKNNNHLYYMCVYFYNMKKYSLVVKIGFKYKLTIRLILLGGRTKKRQTIFRKQFFITQKIKYPNCKKIKNGNKKAKWTKIPRVVSSECV
ncbi:hypothetical protein [Plasmodium yoelii yoelii]|uniref:Uncharacterized protein n=1 Tax=Plasmodium yoelii yoelii TaxID=73239 RepID=Q7RQS3_PLAYO|nr:hypothetical protein [Plasmodium yoelii yoelii]